MATGVPLASSASRVVTTGARWSRWVALVAVLGGVALNAVPVQVADPVAFAVAGVGLLAGVPHGSVDHRIAAGLSGWPTSVITIGYAALAGLTWALLAFAGPVALVAVLALSVAHFGLGELDVLRATTTWRPSRPVALAIAVAATGALVLPLARSGGQLSAVAAAVSPPLGSLLGDTGVRVVLVVVWIVAASVAVSAALRARRPTVVLDVLLVGALGAFAPPLVAFAVWFGGWHALRHTARLLTVDPHCSAVLAEQGPRPALRALLRAAALPTVAALATLTGLLILTAAAADPVAAMGTTLRVLLALTVPHMLVVLWLDGRKA